MLFTIGYQRTALTHLLALLAGLGNDSLLVDVRSSPASRRKEFAQASLSQHLGGRYIFAGQHLGGRTPVTQAGIRRLRQLSDEHNVIIMCMEHAPGECHRHHDICAPHFPRALHIVDNNLITARHLAEAMLPSAPDSIIVSGNTDAILAGDYSLF